MVNYPFRPRDVNGELNPKQVFCHLSFYAATPTTMFVENSCPKCLHVSYDSYLCVFLCVRVGIQIELKEMKLKD